MPGHRRVSANERFQTQRAVTALLAAALAACGGGGGDAVAPDAGGAPDAGAPADDAAPPGPQACAAGGDGLDCLFAQWDALDRCDAELLAAFAASMEARRGALPAWHQGRALFASWSRPVAVAGDFNGWSDAALVTAPVCGTALHVAEAAVASGRHEYKLVDAGTWQLDPENWAYAFDDFGGNPDGRNSVLNSYDSGLGHLVRPPDDLCSDALGNCRPLNAYLPAGYGAPANAARAYPVLFMHDGQNIFDDTTCCFGFGGWGVNVTLDDEIAAGRVEPVVVVGFDNALGQRSDEYGWPESEGGRRAAFMQFQVDAVQPAAMALWRLDPARVYTAGSSLGGNISFHLAFAYPDVYAGAASLSGAFFPGEDTGAAFLDVLAAAGKIDMALYLDVGGDATTGDDGYPLNIAVRDALAARGWTITTSPDCDPTPDALCFFHDDGAPHNEVAWRLRSWRFLRALFPA
jgi:hypothetical protein